VHAAEVVDSSQMQSSLHVTASLEVLAEVRAFVRSTTRALGADRRTVGALVQAVDEWVTNVVVHGYGGNRTATVEVGPPLPHLTMTTS